MRADIKRRWVDALRSGEYKQGKYRLAQSNGDDKVGYCCLGVLCDLVKNEVGMDWFEDLDSDDNVYVMFGRDLMKGDSTYPPGEVFSFVGEDVSNVFAFGDDIVFHLSTLNDNWKLTFDQIADIIDYCL